jgi:hypothetical protein
MEVAHWAGAVEMRHRWEDNSRTELCGLRCEGVRRDQWQHFAQLRIDKNPPEKPVPLPLMVYNLSAEMKEMYEYVYGMYRVFRAQADWTLT